MNKALLILAFLAFSITGIAQNVGVGTPTPLMKLHISKADSAVLLLENTQTLNQNISNALYFKTGNGTYPYTGAIKTIGTGTSIARMGLFTYASSTANGLLERLSITDDGNVGIGTPSPLQKLDVNGSGSMSALYDRDNASFYLDPSSTSVLNLVKITGGSAAIGKILTSDANGLASWVTPSAPSFVFGTDQSLGNNDFIGLGTSSSSFIRNTLVIPFNCEMTSIIFSIRQASPNTNIILTLWKSSNIDPPTATPLSATIFNGQTQTFASATGSVPLLQGDLISVQISWFGGSLSLGATATVTYKQ